MFQGFASMDASMNESLEELYILLERIPFQNGIVQQTDLPEINEYLLYRCILGRFFYFVCTITLRSFEQFRSECN